MRDPLGVRGYLARDWTGLAALKDAHWLARHADRAPVARIEAAGELRAWAHSVAPNQDHSDARRADLASHVRVSALFRRADAWLTR